MTRPAWVIHPIAIALYPTLLLYSRNRHAVEFAETFWPAGLTLIATALVWGGLRILRLDASRAALLVSTALILFFSFGHGVRLAVRFGIGLSPVGREGMILAVEVLALAVVVALVLKRPALARASTPVVNASALALVVFAIVGIVNPGSAGSRSKLAEAARRPAPRLSPPAGRLPDVYFVVLDAYGRSDSLKEVTGFDNSAFLARLEAKGFQVAHRSRANYCQTALALSATLNLRYLDDLGGNPSDDRRPLKHLIADNAVFRAFRDLGYRIVTFDSGFDATETIPADLTLGPPGNLRTFPTMLVDQTPLWLLIGQRSAHQPHRMHRERILKVFEDLPVAGHPSDRPTLTFAHVLSPHPPFIFDADGHDVSGREGVYSLNDSEGWRNSGGHGDAADYARRYADQLAYVTARVEEVVDRILASSAVEPIIIIQGDHGPGSHFEAGADLPNDLVERMTVLNAIYLPKRDREPIHPAITPVNTFRWIFDRCFGSKLGLVEDRSYYSPFQRPYEFTDVTGKID